MKLDIQDDFGAVIRLHDFNHADLQQLGEALGDLADGVRSVIPLHELRFVQPLAGCRMTLQAADRDEGIHPSVDPNLFGWLRERGSWQPYACLLSRPTWSRVAASVESLHHLRLLSGVYVWLHRHWESENEIHWLLSSDGTW